ncbi:TfpX/TfpZ family type IV pilin accessory protein [Curvibacter sp. APW13]|uniref:TfpX/TfpZ family type IV pilin accessory protein n=1 Tax=Curvibacter sp. APW13 TaxID=3077236 RepID=UPI0028DF6604|nr:TfpX/TfpZ family type IV pilin accessory protein [Curvibacter sp. APW13]MDT8990138.1 TfpX/TfpZ family type IV pilin accessory protein [Curvibacter sp. APW13]
MISSPPAFWKDKLQASGLHFSLSVLVAALSALLVFVLWYPYPYREISGGRELFLLVVTVDVIMGPLITLAIFDRRKPWAELRRDLFVVVLLQLSALGYGLWTVAMARPVHMVFEIDRFRIVHAIDIPDELLSKTPEGITARPYTGPTLLGLRPFKDGQEEMDATFAALQGVNLGARPDLWQSFDASRQDVLRIAKPVGQLRQRFPDQSAAIDAALAGKGAAADAAQYLPLAGRKDFWTVMVDGRNGDILGFLPLDSF